MIFNRRDARDGWLGLTEISLSKVGFASVGCEREHGRRTDGGQMRRSRQRLIGWFWITKQHSWPLAVRLYLPHRWTQTEARAGGTEIPTQFQRYRTRGEIALDLLKELQPPTGRPLSIVVKASFTEEWALLTELFHRSELVMARLNSLAQWPVISEFLSERQTLHGRDLHDRFMHGRLNKVRGEEMRRLELKAGARPALQRLPASPGAVEPLLRLDRYLFSNIGSASRGGVYLVNRLYPMQELLAVTSRLNLLRLDADEFRKMAKRFQGRTWRGLHHHLALCAMADYFKASEESK